jgi:CRP-like cAMP-binding protein
MPTLPMTIGWRVLETARVAILDDAFMGHLADYPQLGGRLVGRAVTRSRNIAVNMAIVHQARVDVRLHMLFWHLAARWGRVGSGGVTVPLRLTHAVLAELVAARRPTVTSALTLLSKRGVVRPTDNGWLLAGESPGELRELARLTGQKAA